MKFKPLIDFKSREFAGTQYVKGMTYTIRHGNEKLRSLTERWLNAVLFKPNESMTFLDMYFEQGKVSYCIDDDFANVVKNWVAEGKAEYVDGAMITFEVEEAGSGLMGG